MKKFFHELYEVISDAFSKNAVFTTLMQLFYSPIVIVFIAYFISINSLLGNFTVFALAISFVFHALLCGAYISILSRTVKAQEKRISRLKEIKRVTRIE